MSFPRLGSAVLVQDYHKVLLGLRAKDPNRGMWVIPGGKVETFESIAEAGRREIKEETGLDVEMGPQIGVFEIIEPPDQHRVIVFSWARRIGGELQAASDLSAVQFFTFTDLHEMNLAPIARDVLKLIGWA